MKKVIKIYSFPSHSPKGHISGVDYPRIIQPCKFLDGYSDGEVTFKVTSWNGESISIRKWNEICQEQDIIYLNYTVNDRMFATMGCLAQMHGCKLVCDLDDALWYVGPHEPVYETYKKGSEGIAIITDILNACDYVTCTNPYLANAIANNTKKDHDHIEVFPNTVDLSLYNQVPEFKDTPNINIVHYGSKSHTGDLTGGEFVKGMDRIMQDYPNVTFITVASFFPEFKKKWGRRYEEERGDVNFMAWATKRFPEVMAKTDIFVAPLIISNVYNRCKSSIKFAEVSTAKKPGCWANLRQYQEVVKPGVNGFLCETADEWYKNIKTLCDDAVLRKSMGEEAYKTVVESWQSKDQVKNYVDFFKSMVK